MRTAVFLFAAIGFLLSQDVSGASPNFSGWTPTCVEEPPNNFSIILPSNTNLTDVYAVVVGPATCKDVFWNEPTTTSKTLSSPCVEPTSHSVTVSFQPKGRNFAGGHTFTEVLITCKKLDDNGHVYPADFKVTISIKASPTPMDALPPPPTMQLVKKDSPLDSIQTLTLGQENVQLKITGPGAGYILLPTNCEGKSVQNPTTSYTFLKAESSTCNFDNEVLGALPKDIQGDFVADFYPFMFTSGDSITLTCKVLVCPDIQTGNCGTTKTLVEGCTAGAVPQPPTTSPSARRRRSARESQPDTHVVEVTYTVVGHDPALDGQTAAGAVVSVSIPLLAAVASLWIL